jgi:hypothetical protein
VDPVFTHLLKMDPTGEQWLDALLELGLRATSTSPVPPGQRLVANHGPRWGKDEHKLPAPQALLECLVTHIDAQMVDASSSSAAARKKRHGLATGDANAITEALTKIRAGRRGRGWFVLEGPSMPDALLETEHAVVCIEGKRTEAKCTTHTSWMRTRSQLIRHMDAAMERYPSKQIYGLLIVEGDGDESATQPSAHWILQCAAQYESIMLDNSLPHRTADERERIANGILGVATWQSVCARVGPDWTSLPDVI